MRMEEIFAQHERLNISLDRLVLLARGPLEGALPEGRVRSVFEQELAGLAEDLRAHFAFEEEGGYLPQVLKAAPNLAPRVEALKAEHPLLVSRAEALRRAFHEKPLKDFRREVDAFIAQLNDHERREAELLQATLRNGPSAGD